MLNNYTIAGITLFAFVALLLIVRFILDRKNGLELIWMPVGLFIAILKFALYCFDLYPPFQKSPSDPPRPSAWDRMRMLHLSWHSVVYVPVVVVSVVAKVIGASLEDVVFFASVALATVALETCVGVILSKATEIEDLSRQTRRAIRLHDTSQIPEWIEYFMLRHQAAKLGLAKAALVTVVSMVMFSTIVGVEVIRMTSHSAEHKVQNVITACIKTKAITTITDDQRKAILKEVKESSKEEVNLLFPALTLCLSMMLIAMAKVWAQSRSSLREHDAMDYFPTGKDAKDDFDRDPYFHMCGQDLP